ncbi:unnamed protein product [Angiostrongylus costaricensis]|uniref:ShTK domain protein n=1 Tax=Angiostrongylus costaricensis TaxID=334426 RepID=A0A0R3PZK5_ANGCS|nr:unnamed protein product [Angiostrongylus costaricensis]
MRCIIFVLLFLALLESTTAGAPADLNCTEYTECAVNCKDKFSSATCLVIYTAAVKVGTSDERNAKCFQDAANQRNEEVVQLAINICPKTCGYCCLTPAFNCKNKDVPRVKCETVTKEQCDDPTWRTILTEDCPAVCGFCDQRSVFIVSINHYQISTWSITTSMPDSNCTDTAVSCKSDVSICRNVDLQDFVRLFIMGGEWLLHKYVLHRRAEATLLWQSMQSVLAMRWQPH